MVFQSIEKSNRVVGFHRRNVQSSQVLIFFDGILFRTKQQKQPHWKSNGHQQNSNDAERNQKKLHMIGVPTSTKTSVAIDAGKMSVRETIVRFDWVAVENFQCPS